MKKFLLAALLLASPAAAQQVAPDAINGCVYNSALPALAAGQHAQVQCDSSGRLIVGSSASANYVPSQVSVAASATLLVAARATGRNAVIITNMGTTAVYLGGAGVTSATGGYLAGVVGAVKVIPFNGALYGITGGGTQSVSVEELY